MKRLRPLFFFLLFPFFGSAQSLNGVYTGVLSNDSTTVRKDQSFEMALTEYNGKVYGYAYSTFIVNDTLYYIVKRVKGKVDGDICEVEDDEVITHNFPQKPEKKVFVTYTLRRDATDSIWRLDGNWKTNLTKKYYAISGKVETKEEKDLSKSKLYEHLGDLDLQKTLVLSKPKPKETKADVAKNTVKKNEKKDRETKPVDKKPDPSIAKSETKIPEDKNNSVKQPGLDDKKTESSVAKNETKVADNKIISTSSNPPIQNEKKDIASSNPTPVDKKPENNIAKADTKLPDNKTVPAATNNSQVQTVNKDVTTNNNDPDKKTDVVKTETKVPDNKTTSDPVNNQTITVNQETKIPDTKSNSVLVNNPVKQDDKKNTVLPNSNTIDKKPENNITKADNKSNTIVNNQPKQNENKNAPVVTTNPNEKKLVSVPVGNLPVMNEKKDIAVADNNKPADKKTDASFEFQELKRTNRTLKPAAKLVDGRATAPSETIYFKSDSLSIALYDNGEVDGDTVSVIINDEMFIERQGLKSSAFRKTFYIPQEQSDSLLVVLYANNLGKYPPNTGLLQIKDGEEIFYVRFKADLDKNAAIVLRRKSK